MKRMGVLGHNSALQGCPGPWTSWANEIVTNEVSKQHDYWCDQLPLFTVMIHMLQ